MNLDQRIEWQNQAIIFNQFQTLECARQTLLKTKLKTNSEEYKNFVKARTTVFENLSNLEKIIKYN